MMWALDGHLEVQAGDQRVTASSVVIPSGGRHAVRADSRRLVLALVEPWGARGRALMSHPSGLVGRGTTASPSTLPTPAAASNLHDLLTWFDAAFADHGWRDSRRPLSRHVEQALRYIEKNISGMPRLTEAAAAAHLSPSHLTHVFSQETGMPFRRYVLWARLVRAVEAVSDGGNLTEAALRAGFSDSAHLSRVFRANFGLPPSLLQAGIRVAGRLGPADSQPQRSSAPG